MNFTFVPFYRIESQQSLDVEEMVPMGFSIEMHRHTAPDGEWGKITLGGQKYWADPVLANRKFRTVVDFVQSNIRANWDLRLVRSGTVVNLTRTRSHQQ